METRIDLSTKVELAAWEDFYGEDDPEDAINWYNLTLNSTTMGVEDVKAPKVEKWGALGLYRNYSCISTFNCIPFRRMIAPLRRTPALGDVVLHSCIKNSHGGWPLIICLV